MGDCASWIKNFPKSNWFNFTSDTNVKFAMNNFHFKKALTQLTTKKYPDIRQALQEYIDSNNKKDFNMLVGQFKDLFPERIDTIESNQKYILNNWKERQTYLKNPHMKCSMESHISHNIADLFTSRPKAYSKNGLIKLYLNQLINPTTKTQINQLKINPNKIIFLTDTKTNKYLNNFYETGIDFFDYTQKEINLL